MKKGDEDSANIHLQKGIHLEIKDQFSEIAYEHFLKADNNGMLVDPDGYASLTGKCGDTIEIFLKFKDYRVIKASYQTNGCAWSNICGSLAAEMTLGREPEGILEITGEVILEALGHLPDHESHCAFLAAESVQEALHDYMLKTQREKKRGEASKGL
jgi:nitrogen fixation NifU-like protein